MKQYLLWFLLIISVVIRFIIYYHSKPLYSNGTKIRLSDSVTAEPIRYTNSQYLKVKGFKIYLPLYPEIYYGDRVIIEGFVDGDRLKEPVLIDLSESKIFLFSLRKSLIDFYQKSLPQPHSSLLAGVTIGSKSSIPTDFWEVLKQTGTAHVVVASGMNVTLVASFLVFFLAIFLPRKKAIPVALLGVWCYAALSGFDAPIIRASIMGSLVFAAQEIGRLNFSLRTLLVTGFVMLMIRPDWLFDIGFQLSFAATLSLILFESKVDRVFYKLPSVIRKDFSTSLAAQVGVVPILYFGFGQFNIFSPVINALVLWTIVPITVIGMLGGPLGLLFEPVGTLILWLAYPLTSWFVWIIDLMSNF